MSLLAQEVELFAQSLKDKVDQKQPDQTADAFIDFWTTHLSQHQAMLMLLSVAGHILEKNISDTVLLHSKKRIVASSMQWTMPSIHYFFPHWDAVRVQESLDLLVVLANGLFSFCGLNSSQKKLLCDNGLEEMVSQGFDTEYRQILHKIGFGRN